MSKLREEEFYYQYEKNGGTIEMPRTIFWELYEDGKELENIIDELEKYLAEQSNLEGFQTDIIGDCFYSEACKVVLDKLKELKKNNML